MPNALDSYHPSKVIDIEHWNDSLLTLRVSRPPAFSFVPGQYCKLALEIHDQLVMRPFSIASAPQQDYVSFLITKVEDGSLSTQLHQLELGKHLWIEKRAHGFFVITELPPAPHLWLIATGSGISPFLSILQDGQVLQNHQRVTLVHGVRFANELVHKSMLQNLAHQHDNFDYVACISREQLLPTADSATSHLVGRITNSLADGRLETALHVNISPQQNHFMLCGNPNMIDEIIELLRRRGCSRHRRRSPGHISVEKFW